MRNPATAARSLFADAEAMLARMRDEDWLTLRAVAGFWPAEAEGDDIVLVFGRSRTRRHAILHTLRQQVARERNTPNLALADFVAPSGTGISDYVGAFALTAGIGEEAIAERFRADKDDYSAILLSALPTAWPRHSPNICIAPYAVNCGAMRRLKTFPMRS